MPLPAGARLRRLAAAVPRLPSQSLSLATPSLSLSPLLHPLSLSPFLFSSFLTHSHTDALRGNERVTVHVAVAESDQEEGQSNEVKENAVKDNGTTGEHA